MAQLIKHENNEAVININITWEEFTAAIKKAYNQNKGKFKVPGFRNGKVPQKIIEKQYGEGVFYEDAINMLFPTVYPAALDELDIEPVDRPALDIKTLEKGEDVVLEITVATKPVAELGQYKGLELKLEKAEVTDEMVMAELEKEQDMNGRMVEVTGRAAESGDTVVIDYKGSIDGEYFEGGSAENTHLELGSGKFIPGFEEQLVGSNSGDEVKVEVTFPEEYGSEELAGKDAIFEVTVHEIKNKELPEIDDEFIMDISEFDTVDEYKENKRKELAEKAEENHKMQLREMAIEMAVDNALVDIPAVMVDHELEHMFGEIQNQISMYGITMEQYFNLNNTTKEEMSEQMRNDAETRVKTSLVLETIIAEEGIVVTEEEIDEELTKFAEAQNKDLEEIKAMFAHNEFQSIKDYLAPKKAIDFLIDNAVISE